MNILEAMESLLKAKPTGKEPIDDHVKDGVFYPTLYRLGREDHKDCPREEREALLNYLESQK